MKVLQVLHNYPPEFRGGVERAVEQLTQELRRLGHESVVLAGSERSAPEYGILQEEWEGQPVFRIVRPGGLRSPVDCFEPEVVGLYEELLERHAPDVVHLHHWWNLGDDLVRRAARAGKATCVTLHDHFNSCSLFFRMRDGLIPCEQSQDEAACAACVGTRFGLDEAEVAFGVGMRRRAFAAELSAAGAILAPSQAHADLLARFTEKPRRIEVVPLGSRLHSAVEPVGERFPATPLRILHFGNLSRLKGVEVLARAVELADPAGDRIELLLAGAQVEADLDTGRARLHGPYERDDLRALAESSDLAVFASLALESYGLVVDEALSLGLPVVVSDRGALAERIGSRGLSFEAGNAEALAAHLRAFLDDPSRLEQLQSARDVDLWTPARHAARTLEIYGALRPPVEVPDLEGPLLKRVARYRQRIDEIAAALARMGGGA